MLEVLDSNSYNAKFVEQTQWQKQNNTKNS